MDSHAAQIVALERRVAELEQTVRLLVAARPSRPAQSRRVRLEDVIRQRYVISDDDATIITTETLLADLDTIKAFPGSWSPRSRAMAVAQVMRALGARRWTNGTVRGYRGVRHQQDALTTTQSDNLARTIAQVFEITKNLSDSLTPDELMTDLRFARAFPEGMTYEAQRELMVSALGQLQLQAARWRSGLGTSYLGIRRRPSAK